ncbi:hypothetical protein M422DRAFT_177252, partial [Sphaerobolus stellatus SS14]
MDESGFTRESTRTQRVYGGCGVKHQYRQGNTNQENTTVLITICADGTTTKPVVVFKGENMMNNWFKDNVADCMITRSRNAWTEQEIAEDWIKKFNFETRLKANSEPRALFLDGHNSHYSPKLLRYAKECNIIIFGYPPHCTHALQGLDVVFFARMKEEFGKAIETFKEEHNRGVGKGDFVYVFGSAFLKVAQVQLIKTSFSAMGIVPFNPKVISAEKMKPSKATSVKGAFPLVQPSPVRAAVKYLDLYRPTSFERDPQHAKAPIGQLGTIPEHPRLDPNIDPTLRIPSTPNSLRNRNTPPQSANKPKAFTPSKAVRILISQLAATTSGSYLVSDSPLKSTTPIISPIIETPPNYQLRDWDAEEITSNIAKF